MKKWLIILAGSLLLGGLVVAASTDALNEAKHILSDEMNTIIQSSYDQGFIDGYGAGFKAAKEQQNSWDNTHS